MSALRLPARAFSYFSRSLRAGVDIILLVVTVGAWRREGAPHPAGAPLEGRLALDDTLGSAVPMPSLRPVGTADGAAVFGRGGTGRLSLSRRMWAWAVRHRSELVALTAVVVLAGLVQAWGMDNWPARFDDEGTYTAQAWATQYKGVLAPYTYWYDHPPFGWMQIALWTTLTGAFGRTAAAVNAGREFTLLIEVASFALVYLLGRRLELRRGFAAAAALLFAVCPLALFWHRQVLLDNLAVMWALAAFVLALSPQRRLWAFAGSAACFAAALLSKETILIVLPSLGLAVWQNADRRTRRFCCALFATVLFLVAGTYLLFATLKSELIPGPGHVSLVGGVLFQLVNRSGSGSVFDATSGSHATVMGWLHLDPWLLAAAVGMALPALLVRRLRAISLAFALQAATLMRPGYLPFPYVIAWLPFAALVVAGMADVLWGWHPQFACDVAKRYGWPRRALSPVGWTGPATVVACAAGAALLVAPAWVRGDSQAMTFHANTSFRQAEQWILTHVPRGSRLITDNVMWVDLVKHFGSPAERGGFYSNTVVWSYKLNLDPAVRTYFPRGWREFDYVVSTPGLRATVGADREAAAAMRHSVVVVRFGQDPSVPRNSLVTDPDDPLGGRLPRIEIRRITPSQRSPDIGGGR